MTSYLEHGWYADEADRTRLRTEVIDGAMDVAGMLLRASVPARRILRVALRVRSLVVIADPLMRGTSRFGDHERRVIGQRIAVLTDGFPELQGFVNDCLENVHGAHDMTAFYLHLVHVTRMMQLLSHAASGFSGMILGGTSPRTGPAKKTPTKTSRKKAKKKRPAKKPQAKKKVAKKKAKQSRPAKKAKKAKKARGKTRPPKRKTARTKAKAKRR